MQTDVILKGAVFAGPAFGQTFHLIVLIGHPSF